jgi:ammonia channel protein AmtB
VGNVLTALFAQASIAGSDGFTVIPGGWLETRHWRQLGIQIADSVAGLAYSFVMTVSTVYETRQSQSLIFFFFPDRHSLDYALHSLSPSSR